ncbi:MAG: F0F1 ATP synthase subunit gamma [Rickettsiales bacterium]
MSNLQILKSRIKSINVILKATNAVKTITNIKLSQLKNNIKHYNLKFKNSLNILKMFANYLEQENINENFLLKDNNNNKIAILIFSDKGLCGGYNAQLNKFFLQHIQTKNLQNLEKQDIEKQDIEKQNNKQNNNKKLYNKIIIIGNKGKKYTKQYNFADKIFYYPITKLNLNSILDLCKNLTFCDLFFNKYNTILDQKPSFFSISNNILNIAIQENILSNLQNDNNNIHINKSQINNIQSNLKNDFNVNSITKQYITVEYKNENLYSFQQDILENYLINKLNNVIMNSRLSEECARLVMMDASIKNAEDLSNNLTLQMNKKRQNNITNQIMEINASIMD